MTLADIRKEEVDPLLAQIKNLMSNDGKAMVLTALKSNSQDTQPEDDNVLVLDQFAEFQMSMDNLNPSHHEFPIIEPISPHSLNKQDSGDTKENPQTVDKLVRELLRPLLKDWLEAHLPAIVKTSVNAQINKLIEQYQETIDIE